LNKKETKRITFNEITKPAILKAIESPRNIDKNLVDAQQARRVLDRIVGFELSPVLWRKVRPSLSAGRVQSVAVRLIVEREKEIEKHQSTSFIKIQGLFHAAKGKLKAEFSKQLDAVDEAEKLLNNLKEANYSVVDVTEKPATKSPAAPFTTSTLQQEASLKLGFSVSRTMSVAQKLYESGKITYMRTDSVNLSESAVSGIKSEIERRFGSEYSNPTKYKTKSSGAQEAHEAIRPTDFSIDSIAAERDEQRLYELIWKRTLASQMSHAKLERTTIKIGISNVNDFFNAKGEVVKFDGFLRLYLASNVDEVDEDDSSETLLPQVQINEVLKYDHIVATERFNRPAPRYVEASLVKKLEELGIGRPSTYAPTISTIQKRGYVEKKEREGVLRNYAQLTLNNGKIEKETKSEITGKESNKLFPTDIGVVVTEFLEQHFTSIMDYHFTAKVEEEFDNIAKGMVEWTEMIRSFYNPFHENVDDTLEHSERATGERFLGTHPESGRKVIARIGRFGPMIQIGDEKEDGEKPLFASLKKDQSISTLTLEDALNQFKLPRILGSFENQEIKANNGRFGPYVQLGKDFISIPKDENPLEITLERALELIQTKRQEDANKLIKTFDERPDVQLLNGRFGAYMKIGKDNFKLPKGTVPENLNLEECLQIAQDPKNASGKFKKKKA
jgi:DNA topoisomerase-1